MTTSKSKSKSKDYDPETLTADRAKSLLVAQEIAILGLLLDLRRSNSSAVNTRWASIARTHFQQGFMAMNRALYRPFEE